VETVGESPEERKVCLVPHRRADGMDAHAQLASKDGSHAGEDTDVDMRGKTALDADHLRV
jgi:hypothetical protein